jgi:hypothetical protein
MSPEQAEGQQAGPPSDVFSLGCVLAYAATGNAPFGGGSAASILYRVVTGEPDLSGVPGNLRQAITACMVKNPAERISLAQLGPMIAALGPAMSGSLGSFWPEPLAGIIAADNTHPVTQVSAPPFSAPPVSGSSVSGAPASGAPVNAAPVSGAPASAAPVSGGAFSPAVSQVMGSVAPVSQVPQPNSLPPGATPGLTGHAPMVADGYYAAAAHGESQYAQPSAAQSSAAQSSAAQPQYGQPSVEQAWAPQYPAGQQQAPWPQSNPSMPPTTPASQYASTYGAPSWPQQQPSSGGSWPGSGQPSGPGGPGGPSFPSAGTPLAQYAPGSGPQWRPTKAQIPPPVLGAIRLMYVGAAVTAAQVIFGAVVAANDNAYWLKYRYRFPVVAKHSHTMAATLDSTAVLGGAIGIICWLVVAAACRRGRSWTRIAGTVLLALDTAILLTVLLATHNDPGVKAASLVVWIIGLAAAVPLWGRQARNFYLAWRKR